MSKNNVMKPMNNENSNASSQTNKMVIFYLLTVSHILKQ